MLSINNKRGGNDFDMKEGQILREAVDFCGLADMSYEGYDFTWNNHRGGEENIQERRDRFLANQAWRNLFPGTLSDHFINNFE